MNAPLPSPQILQSINASTTAHQINNIHSIVLCTEESELVTAFCYQSSSSLDGSAGVGGNGAGTGNSVVAMNNELAFQWVEKVVAIVKHSDQMGPLIQSSHPSEKHERSSSNKSSLIRSIVAGREVVVIRGDYILVVVKR